VALSQDSVASSYVTFEWAYGLGKGKTIVPLRLEACKVHPRLEPIQYLDFSVPGSLPWNLDAASAIPESPQQDATVTAILAYLNQRGYQMVSYDRIRRRIDSNLTDERLDAIVDGNPTIFRHVRLKEGKRGLKKLVP
jgi:hypothetical protein